ncbi:MAG: AAA family ATPase [Spirochaetales bacterium]|nr:AAA family ATPase [Spirochaetales bacterium]
MNLKENLQHYIDAGYPIIYIDTFEERKTDGIISSVIGGREAVEWNGAKGFVDFKTKQPLIENKTLAETLRLLNIDDDFDGKILILKDIHPYLTADHPDEIALLKNLAQRIVAGLDARIIMVSPVRAIPRELEKFITMLESDYLTQDDIKECVRHFAKEQELSLSDDLLEELSMALKGMNAFEIESLLSAALVTNGELTRDDLKLIFVQKQQMVMKSGVLEMVSVKESVNDIGGLENLKEWLHRKSKVYKSINKAMEFGVEIPKGMLIAGVPGCGKSLTAKVTAGMFEVPLLRLDMGKIMGKYVGESEENMRRAIALAEAIAPCVLWIDELEKAFAGISGSGNEVTVRLFGTFLTWMQEKTTSAFVIATANDITKLPPELMRKGRFDEIFYVGLPNETERKKIFEIHIGKRRKKDLSSINMSEIVKRTEGFSGADIEGVVKDAVECAFIDDKESLTTEYILDAIKATHSLSEIMKDSLDKLSKEYEQRKFKKASR